MAARGGKLETCGSLTSVPGLYAAGAVVQGFTQISVPMCQAAIAATTINNSLPLPHADYDQSGLRHLRSETRYPTLTHRPVPRRGLKGDTLPLSYHPVRDIA